MTSPSRLILLLALSLAAPAARGADATFIIVNPAGRGNQSQASGFLADFARALEASWPEGAGPCPTWRGHYHVHQADALASMKGSRPIFGLLSPGFYFAVREEVGAVPALVPVQADGSLSTRVRFVAVAGSGAARRLEAGSVEGLRLGGQIVGEPTWTRRVLLAGLEGAETAELVPQARALGALRSLRKAEVEAVLLPEEEWSRLEELGMAGGLVALRQVEGLLPGPLALLEAPGAEDEETLASRRALGEAALASLLRFPETEAGRAVLETMGLKGFARADADDYHRLAALQDGAPRSPGRP